MLEEVKNGKVIILYISQIFREVYCLKNGDIVWRCLGKTCKATIKTISRKTAIHFSNDMHTGTHPVTMRNLKPSPPGLGRRCGTATPSAETDASVVTSSRTPEIEPTVDINLSFAPIPSPDLQWSPEARSQFTDIPSPSFNISSVTSFSISRKNVDLDKALAKINPSG